MCCLLTIKEKIFSHLFTLSFIIYIQIFVDKAAKRAVLSLGVKCVNWKRKCDWTGDLLYVEVSGLHSLDFILCECEIKSPICMKREVIIFLQSTVNTL